MCLYTQAELEKAIKFNSDIKQKLNEEHATNLEMSIKLHDTQRELSSTLKQYTQIETENNGQKARIIVLENDLQATKSSLDIAQISIIELEQVKLEVTTTSSLKMAEVCYTYTSTYTALSYIYYIYIHRDTYTHVYIYLLSLYVHI